MKIKIGSHGNVCGHLYPRKIIKLSLLKVKKEALTPWPKKKKKIVLKKILCKMSIQQAAEEDNAMDQLGKQ